MKRHHAFLKPVAGVLSMACLVGAQYACQVNAPGQAGGGGADGGGAPAGGGDGDVHWSYEGETGAQRWGGLDPSFAICDSGV